MALSSPKPKGSGLEVWHVTFISRLSVGRNKWILLFILFKAYLLVFMI